MVTADQGTICELAMIGGGDPNTGYLIWQLQGLNLEVVLATTMLLALLASYGRRIDTYWNAKAEQWAANARDDMEPHVYRRLQKIPVSLETDWTRSLLFSIFALNGAVLFNMVVVPHLL